VTTSAKIYVAMGVFVLVLAIAIPTVILKKGSSPQFPSTGISPSNSPGLGIGTFSGKISKVDAGCSSGVDCSVTVSGRKIILFQEGLPQDTIAGRITGINSMSDLSGQIGSFASVYAGLTPSGDYTIYGNSSYYIEVFTLDN
jgi:hypothetical protein